MRRLGIMSFVGGPARRAGLAMLAVAGLATVEGCGSSGSGSGGSDTTTTTKTETTTAGTGGTGGTGTGGTTTTSSSATGGTGGTTTTTGGGGSGGTTTSSTTGPTACTATAKGSTRGSAIALTSDDSRLVVVNRDAGSVTVMSVTYDGGGEPVLANVAELIVGGEPWQVVIDGCDDKAYVVLRKDQKVVEITGLEGTPAIGNTVAVGSEPSALALTPNNTKLYVSNWVDGTLSVIDPLTMTVTGSVDLNATIAATGLLGTVSARPALAHPRGLAITNNGDASDTDEAVYATEWFAVRTGPEDATATNSDHNWKGLLYKVAVGSTTASTIDLPPIVDTGFKDAKGQATGCFPNQVASVTIDGGFAYVTSTCASPVGPVGVFQRGACTATAQCASFGALSTCSAGVCTLSCATDADCGPIGVAGDCVLPAGTCKPTVNNVKTTTHPGLTIVDLSTGTGTTTALDKKFQDQAATNAFGLRVPLLPTDMDFKPGFGYVAGQGTDALFRLAVTNGAITAVGSASNNFINLRTGPADGVIRLPIGLAVSRNKAAAFVANDGSRDVTAIDLSAQAIATAAGQTDFRILASAALPTAGSPEESALKGKRFFNTGLGRWSLRGEGWGSCGACHIDGLTDNVTWYFARGPRQTTSLDGTFASNDGTDQRILNWSAINDEVADFEGNIRGISGGVGAIVKANGAPCTVATQGTDCPGSTCNAATLKCNISVQDRINTAGETPQQQGLQGSSAEIASPTGTTAHPHSIINDWAELTSWVKTIRSPRRPSNLAAADVTAGKALFSDPLGANCVGCHSGAKWTISRMFYTPDDLRNDAFATSPHVSPSLSLTSWNKPVAGFPAALFPSTLAGSQTMRSGAPPNFEQIQCVLRPVGTIGAPASAGGVPTGVSDPMVGVLELRQDMKTGAQGSGTQGALDFTVGFNPPSLLGLSVGAPFYHAGNARTLEELFSTMFKSHYQSPIAQVFNPTQAQVKQLVAYLLSIDESEPTFAIPAAGNKGGDICFSP